MFPIAWMYYFGTNLESRFAVPDFWPKPEETYKLPYEKQDIRSELDRLRQKRLERRARRLEPEGQMDDSELTMETQQPQASGTTSDSPVGGEGEPRNASDWWGRK